MSNNFIFNNFRSRIIMMLSYNEQSARPSVSEPMASLGIIQSDYQKQFVTVVCQTKQVYEFSKHLVTVAIYCNFGLNLTKLCWSLRVLRGCMHVAALVIWSIEHTRGTTGSVTKRKLLDLDNNSQMEEE